MTLRGCARHSDLLCTGGSDRLKVSRVKDIAGGFSKFTNSMGATESLTIEDAKVLSELDPATRDALSIVFSGEGNYLQDLVVEEAVRAADSLSRNGAAQAWQLLGSASPFATPGNDYSFGFGPWIERVYFPVHPRVSEQGCHRAHV